MNKMSLTEARKLVAKADRKKEMALERKNQEAAKKLVGKCFKFWNGGGDENWWLYVQILSVSNHWKYVTQFQAEKIQAAPNTGIYGISVEVDTVLTAHNGQLDPAYLPITFEEYKRETDEILAWLGLKRAKR